MVGVYKPQEVKGYPLNPYSTLIDPLKEPRYINHGRLEVTYSATEWYRSSYGDPKNYHYRNP